MKIKILLLVFTLCLLQGSVASAQDHLKFMGVSMTGDIYSFIHALESKGLVLKKSPQLENINGETRTVSRLFGQFWNYTNCHISVAERNGNVTYVWVNINTDSNFNMLIKSLAEKYGQPISSSINEYEWILNSGAISATRFDASPGLIGRPGTAAPACIIISYRDYCEFKGANDDL